MALWGGQPAGDRRASLSAVGRRGGPGCDPSVRSRIDVGVPHNNVGVPYDKRAAGAALWKYGGKPSAQSTLRKNVGMS
jgi:hypothetical protein